MDFLDWLADELENTEGEIEIGFDEDSDLEAIVGERRPRAVCLSGLSA